MYLQIWENLKTLQKIGSRRFKKGKNVLYQVTANLQFVEKTSKYKYC